jgi:hypothetical protein
MPVDKYKLNTFLEIRIEITKFGNYWRLYVNGEYYVSRHFTINDFKILYDILKSKNVNVHWIDKII